MQLPALPQALAGLLEACNDPERDILKIGAIVARDVTISAKILRLANSAFLGARSKFLDIEQAVIYLGIDTIRNLAVSIAVHESFKKPQPQFLDLEAFWHHSLLTALLAKELAETTGYPDPAETYLAGFLHDIGKYVLSLHSDRQYAELLKRCENPEELLHEEIISLGISHAEAGARLILHWNLAPSLAQAIALHHVPPTDLPDDQPVARITALAYRLAEGEDDLAEMVVAGQRLALAELAELRARQQEKVRVVAESLGIPIPALPPRQGTPEAEKGELRQQAQALLKVSGLLDNLIRAKTLNRTFLVLEESLQILFDTDKAVLLLPDRDNLRLFPHGSLRNRFCRQLKKLSLVIDLPSPLQPKGKVRLVRKEDYQPQGQEAKLFQALEAESLLALPVSVGGQGSGLLLVSASSAEGAAEMTETLRHLCAHVGSRLLLEAVKQRQAEALAAERLAAVDRIARSLAHEIANPLAIIRNYVTLLGNRESCSEEMREDLAIVSGEIERIGRISTQLNELSNPPRPADLQPVDLHQLIADTLQLFQQPARLEKNVALSYQGDPRLPQLRTKADCLRQILVNLLGNSLDAVGHNGRIRIESRLLPPAGTGEPSVNAGDRITIAVIDNGPGIDSAMTDRLFRAGHSTKGEGHVGLGLAIVKKLANDLKGDIHYTKAGDETVFTIELPVLPDA